MSTHFSSDEYPQVPESLNNNNNKNPEDLSRNYVWYGPHARDIVAALSSDPIDTLETEANKGTGRNSHQTFVTRFIVTVRY